MFYLFSFLISVFVTPTDALTEYLTDKFPVLENCYIDFIHDGNILCLHCDSASSWAMVYRYSGKLSTLDIGVKKIVITRPEGLDVSITVHPHRTRE